MITSKRSTAKKNPLPGTWFQKNIEYRGEFQYRVLIRRKGHPEINETYETEATAVAFRDAILAKMKIGSLIDLRDAE